MRLQHKGLPFGLDSAAVNAVRQWKFEPLIVDGQPTATSFNTTVHFKLP